jgi:hypothetical protein
MKSIASSENDGAVRMIPLREPRRLLHAATGEEHEAASVGRHGRNAFEHD